jgi:RHS repeat-associated protein
MRYDGADYVYLKNLQGDVVGIVNTSGAIVAEYAYDAWGNLTSTTGNNAIADANPFRYRGYYFDSETGLYYLQSRYYDAEVGRFINADDPEYLEGLTAIDERLGVNLFVYCGNNPVNKEDGSGSFPGLGTILMAFIAGVVASVISTYIEDVLYNLMKGIRGWRVFTTLRPIYVYINRAIVGGLCGVIEKLAPEIGKIITKPIDALLVPLLDQLVEIILKIRTVFDPIAYIRSAEARIATSFLKVPIKVKSQKIVIEAVKTVATKVFGGLGCTFGRALIRFLK